MIDCEARCAELAETLAWIHASVEVEPQKDGTYLITCLDHPLCQDFTRPSLGLSATCILQFNKDGTYERVRA